MPEPTDFFVLDSLANDLENLESILRILNSATDLGWRDQHPAPFTEQAVIPALLRGIRAGNIEACIYSDPEQALLGLGEYVVPQGPMREVWFRLTRRGRLVLESWEPPPLPNASPPKAE